MPALPGQVVVLPSGGEDLPNLQSAVNGLTHGGDIVLVSTSPYQPPDTWLIPPASMGGVVINVKAVGTAVLKPLPGASLPQGLIRVESNWGYKIEGLSLSGQQTDVGIWLARETGLGMNGGTAVIERVSVNGFASGFRLGTTSGTATSEVLFLDCAATNCDIGIELLAFNTLDILLNMWSMYQCRIGVFTSQAGDVYVFGGSASDNTMDFKLTTGGTFSINKFRLEGAKQQFLYSGETVARTNILLDSCEVKSPANPSNTPIIRGGWGNTLTIISCYLDGFVGWEQVMDPQGTPLRQGTLTMISTFIQDGSVSAPPQAFRVDATNAVNLFYRVISCSWRATGKSDGTPDGWISDQTGIVKNGKLVPAWQVDDLGKLTLSNFGVLTGSWTDGTAGQNLATMLAGVGLITNQTS